MLVQTKRNKPILLRRFQLYGLDNLLQYLHGLGPLTRQRFGPHPFNRQAVENLLADEANYFAFTAQDAATTNIVAYALIKKGWLPQDANRLEQYGLVLNPVTDCTFAPSVADAWQGFGVGQAVLQYAIANLSAQGFTRIILWGGVQAGNTKAVHYYARNGFTTLGQFEYNGPNFDMIKYIA